MNIPANAFGYKLRMRYGKWWLYITNKDNTKNLGEIGPYDNKPVKDNTELNAATAELEAAGLVNIEKHLGDR